MLFATHEQALAFWCRLIDYERTTPLPGDFKLEHTRALLRLLGDPQEQVPTVHVAGSKGKGSTAAMLASIARRAGHNTGLFTSPNLCRVEERIQVNGEPIAPDELTALLSEMAETIGYDPASHVFRRLETPPTYFEVAVALGWLYFLRRRVDLAVVEVGLGGRYDATNVCSPEVAVLTSISLEHTRQLGNTLAAIAEIKAGIIKPGRPAVSGVDVPEARVVVERVAAECGSTLRSVGADFTFSYTPGLVTAEEFCRARVRVTTDRAWPELEVALLGRHQAANAAVAVATVEVLRQRGWSLPDAAVAEGLREVHWPARLEVIPGTPLVVLDCAHNVASAEALVETLAESLPTPGPRVLVFASSGDKDVAGMFRVLAPAFAHAFLTRFTSNPRALSPEGLRQQWQAAGGGLVTLIGAPVEALAAARAEAGATGLVCVAGSVFLAGDLRPMLAGDAG